MPIHYPHLDTSVSRRRFIALSAAGAGAVLLRPGIVRSELPATEDDLRFAIISDVHLRYRPEHRACNPATVSNPEDRHAAFFRDAEQWGAEVIVDLGDLQPVSFDEGPGQQALIRWNSWPKEKIAVFGNHDDDHMPKESYLREMGMPSPFYSRTIKGWTFIVLDSGDPAIPPGTTGATWGEEQLPWLRDEIRKAAGRCVILVHNGPRSSSVAVPPDRTKAIIDQANEQAGYRKVVAYFWGHLHRTVASQSAGVHYIMMNSASYRWVSGVGPVWYRDPAPYAMGVLSAADGQLYLHGTGQPGNWAIGDCAGLKEEHRPDDDLTYQASVAPEGS